jgi:hypothetical protein
MKQSDAVFQAVVNVMGEQDGAYKPTTEQRKLVHAILCAGFEAGTIDMKGERDADYIKSYVPGLTSNWLNKDKRLNGGTKYEAKNPGSRTGHSDPQVKAMRLLASTKTDPSEKAEIQAFIDRRLAEIAPASKTVTINVDDLPEALRAKYLAGK